MQIEKQGQGLTVLKSLSKWMAKQMDEVEKSKVVKLKILRTVKERNTLRGYGT